LLVAAGCGVLVRIVGVGSGTVAVLLAVACAGVDGVAGAIVTGDERKSKQQCHDYVLHCYCLSFW